MPCEHAYRVRDRHFCEAVACHTTLKTPQNISKLEGNLTGKEVVALLKFLAQNRALNNFELKPKRLLVVGDRGRYGSSKHMDQALQASLVSLCHAGRAYSADNAYRFGRHCHVHVREPHGAMLQGSYSVKFSDVDAVKSYNVTHRGRCCSLKRNAH
jgi:hypothetical protein